MTLQTHRPNHSAFSNATHAAQSTVAEYPPLVFTSLPDGRGPRVVHVPWSARDNRANERTLRDLLAGITGSSADTRYMLTHTLVDAIAPRDVREHLRVMTPTRWQTLAAMATASLARNPAAVLRLMPEDSTLTPAAAAQLRAGLGRQGLGVYIDDATGCLEVVSNEERTERELVLYHRSRMRGLLSMARACGLSTREARRQFLAMVRDWPSYQQRNRQDPYTGTRWAYLPTTVGWRHNPGGVNQETLSRWLHERGMSVPCTECGSDCAVTPSGPATCACEAWERLPYGSSLSIVFRGEPTPQAPRYVGVEVEVCGRDYYADGAEFLAERKERHGFLVRDGSLPNDDSFELVTSPARGDTLIRDLAAYGRHLEACGAWVDGHAGAHCHVDVRDLSPAERARVVCLYAHVESTLFAGPARGRDREFECEIYAEPSCNETRWTAVLERMADDAGAADLWALIEARRRQPLTSNRSRYTALNTRAYAKHGTFEFRLWPGAVSAERLTLGALISAHIVEQGRRMDPSEYRGTSANDVLRRILPSDVHEAYQASTVRSFNAASYDERDTAYCRRNLPTFTPQGEAESDLEAGWSAYLDGDTDTAPNADSWPQSDTIPW